MNIRRTLPVAGLAGMVILCAATAKPAHALDPCSLITSQQANQLIGSRATQTREDNTEEAQISCVYRTKKIELNVAVFRNFDKVSQADLDQYQAKPVSGIGERAYIVQPYGIMFEKHRHRYFVSYTDKAKSSESGSNDIDVNRSIQIAKMVAEHAP